MGQPILWLNCLELEKQNVNMRIITTMSYTLTSVITFPLRSFKDLSYSNHVK